MRRVRRAALAAVLTVVAACAAVPGQGAAVAKAPEAEPAWSFALHGGAGVIARDTMTPEDEAEYRAAMTAAAEAGGAVLEAGGSSLDAVVAAIRLLEDDPHFNAGKGAVFTAAGRNELDASIMSGADRSAGAVAGVTRVKNPILAARAVMERSPHVMLAGAGAETFLAGVGVELVDPGYFYTERRWNQLQDRLKEIEAAGFNAASADPTWRYGTVGAVARDREGHLAAGTSTGGMTAKLYGRIGDSPVIGAGTYADDAACAVSATGHGEYFIRVGVARMVCARVALLGENVETAARHALDEVAALGGDGGVVLMDAHGNPGWAFNTPGMYRARVTSETPLEVRIFGDEE